MPDIQIDSLDGALIPAYAAYPSSGNGPGLILIHEVFGLNPVMRALCDNYAARGYIAVCPDLFWRQNGGNATNSLSEADWEIAAKHYKSFDIEAGIRDLLACLAAVRKTAGCSGKVGTIGYCLGSRLAFLMAARSDVDCAVSFYGVGLDSMLDEVHDIRSPYLLHIGEQDKLVPLPTQKKISSLLSRNASIQVCVYAHADHGFARVGGAKFLASAADEANKKTNAFLEENLLA